MVEIEILDSVWTRTNKSGHYWLNNILQYDHFYWRKTGFGSEKVVQKIYMVEVHSDGFFFLTGLVEKALTYLEENGVPHKFINNLPEVDVYPPKVEGYEFRHYQQRLIDAGINNGRGQLISPTATGKSIIILGIMSAFPQENILFLVHTKDLVKQMKADVVKSFPNEEIGEWSGKTKQLERITVATIQSYAKVARENSDHFQVIVIDEAHHVSGLDTMYGKVLMSSTAHTKIGLTATRAANEKGRWSAEALLGPVLSEYTLKEAGDDKVLAKPTIHIYKNPSLAIIKGNMDYEEKYSLGIVWNVPRNIKIVEIAKRFIDAGKITLITVTSIEHGHTLEAMFKQYKLDVKFIYGKSTTAERDDIKAGLKDKSVTCAVSSVIFLEGIDIPSLDVVINAGAGVSPVQTMQRIGRALRKTKTKDTAILVDFLDETSATLKRQSEKRIALYESKGWKLIYKK